MGTNKFFVFDENRANLLSDLEYQNSDYRKRGAVAGIAPSNVHNKMYLQSSTMAAAIAQVIADTGKDVSDSDFNLLVSQIKESLGGSATQWRNNHATALGDICYPSTAGSYKMVECTVAGTTGATEPTWGAVGTTVTDGSVTWKVYDVRQGTAIGKVPSLVDVGGGEAGLPAVDGSLLTGLPLPDLSSYLTVTNYNADHAKSLAESGYQKLPSGLIIQWGKTNTTGTTTFPIAFPNACLSLIVDYGANCESGIGGNGNKAGYISKKSVTNTGAEIKFRWPAYTHDNSTGQWQEAYAQSAGYIAIGH